MRLLASVVSNDGVKVAVQVTPLSPVATSVSVPLAIVRSELVRPLTASLKVMVTPEVSPALSASSATTMVAVGSLVSMARSFVPAVPVLPAASV